MTYYAFILGVCEEWPEQRCDLGDIGIAKCLKHHCNISNDNIVEIYDEEATKSNIIQAFKSLLDRRNDKLQNEGKDDILLFYYGGHGKIDSFCTSRKGNEPWIKHLDIINLLEEKFKGGTFVGIIDTCHSGGFGQAVLHKYHTSNNTLNVNYACIMSVPPSDEAGMEWTMGECFIKAFKGELSCYSSNDINNDDITPIYLSTKKGKHPIKTKRAVTDMVLSSNDNKSNACHPSWKQVIEYLSDEMARIKPDRLTTFFLGERMKQFLDQPCIFGDNIDSSVLSSCATASIPRNESWKDPFRREHHAVNDSVYVKMTGHSNVVNAENRLGWFPGQIISIHDNSGYSVELYDVISKTNWTVKISLEPSSSSRSTILCSLPFKVRNPLTCANVITNLANKLAYYDITIPPGVKIKALWKDGEYYKATTISRHEVSWQDVHLSIDMKGPCVPVRYEEDGIMSFVSTSSCRLMKDEKEIILADKSALESAQNITTAMDAMMASLALQGKKLHGDEPLFGSVDEDLANSWEAYDIESASWESVQLMNKVDPSVLPVKVIAYHMCYGRAESFSVVYWESDSTMSIVPNSCLRQRAKTDDDEDDSSNEDNSSSSSSDEGEENHSSDFYKAREYILNSRKEQVNQPEQLSNRISSLHLAQALESLLSETTD